MPESRVDRHRKNKKQNGTSETIILWTAPFKVAGARKPNSEHHRHNQRDSILLRAHKDRNERTRNKYNIEGRLSQYDHSQDVDTWFGFGIHASLGVCKHVERKPKVRKVHFDTWTDTRFIHF